MRAIRKSLITPNQDIPAFFLFVYRADRTVVVIVKRHKQLQDNINMVGSHVGPKHRPFLTLLIQYITKCMLLVRSHCKNISKYQYPSFFPTGSFFFLIVNAHLLLCRLFRNIYILFSFLSPMLLYCLMMSKNCGINSQHHSGMMSSLIMARLCGPQP